MIKPRLRPSPVRPVAPRNPHLAPAPPALGRVAFAASVQARDQTGKRVHVQALCWPTVAAAWPMLTQAWEAVSASRSIRGVEPVTNAATSWLRECAPLLASPFLNTSAEESSLAALLSRTPLQAAVAIVEESETRTDTSPANGRLHALGLCLSAHGDFLRLPGRHACDALVMARADNDAEATEVDAMLRARARQSERDWTHGLRWQFWDETPEPLPLELARLIAGCVLQQRIHEASVNPVFNAVLPKLMRSPFPVPAGRYKRR